LCGRRQQRGIARLQKQRFRVSTANRIVFVIIVIEMFGFRRLVGRVGLCRRRRGRGVASLRGVNKEFELVQLVRVLVYVVVVIMVIEISAVDPRVRRAGWRRWRRRERGTARLRVTTDFELVLEVLLIVLICIVVVIIVLVVL